MISNKLKNTVCILGVGIVLIFTSCTKSFLDEKPSSSIVDPHTLSDFQRLLDRQLMYETPDLLVRSTDEYYWTSEYWQSQSLEWIRNIYMWNPEIYVDANTVGDWNVLYEQVFYTNVVLEGLKKLPKTEANRDEWDRIKGNALFSRAFAFFTAAQLWAPPYDPNTTTIDLGIPIRLVADINAPTTRASVQETYMQILTDLKESELLLTNDIDSRYPNRVSRPAVLGFLSRVYLYMRDYQKAGQYADQYLKLRSELIDYNSLNTTINNPFPVPGANIEVALHRGMITSSGFTNRYPDNICDSNLYNMYDENDLRKKLFFQISNATGNLVRKSGYCGTLPNFFSGIATDEIYLIRAESLAREGKNDLAMNDINTLLRNRYETGSFSDLSAENMEQALEVIFNERRKELFTRSLRWMDCRRLNSEGRNISLRRLIDGVEYILPAKDKRWTYPIPPDVIALTGIPQNER